MRSLTTKVNIVYWLLVVTDTWGILSGNDPVHETVKPLLMPALASSIVLQKTSEVKGFRLVFGALVFSWLGDVFLIFEPYESIFFILGLGSFLLAHLCYIRFFTIMNPALRGLLKTHRYLFLVVGAYCAGLFMLLLPTLGTLKFPVLIYAVVIGSMLLSSIDVATKVPRRVAVFFITGALLFVLSDSILAINKFYKELPGAGAMIMLTYCAAQFFIVKGFIERTKSRREA